MAEKSRAELDAEVRAARRSRAESEAAEALAELTVKERAFVTAYVGPAKGNGATAAEIAGYASQSRLESSVIAHKLKKIPQIFKAIQCMLECDPLVAQREECLHLLSRLVRGEEMEHRVVVDRETGMPSITQVPAQMKDRLAAVDTLAKLHGTYAPKKVALTDVDGHGLEGMPLADLVKLRDG